MTAYLQKPIFPPAPPIADRADLLPPKAVAAMAGVTDRTAQLWAKAGRMGGFKVGGGYRFPRAEVEAALNQAGSRSVRRLDPKPRTASPNIA